MNRILVEPDRIAKRIRKYGRENPELREGKYDGEPGTVYGLCYPLSEAYFHALGGRDSGLDIYCLSWSDVRENGEGTHWYLRNPETGAWIDLGLEHAWQGTTIPYGEGRRRAFMTGYEPSKRTQGVLEAI